MISSKNTQKWVLTWRCGSRTLHHALSVMPQAAPVMHHAGSGTNAYWKMNSLDARWWLAYSMTAHRSISYPPFVTPIQEAQRAGCTGGRTNVLNHQVMAPDRQKMTAFHGKKASDRQKITDYHGKILYHLGKILYDRPKMIDDHGKIVPDHGKIISYHGKIIFDRSEIVPDHEKMIADRVFVVNHRRPKHFSGLGLPRLTLSLNFSHAKLHIS